MSPGTYLKTINQTKSALHRWLTPPTLALLWWFGGGAVMRGNIVGPYAPDSDTIHLWHMNEPLVPVIDVGSGGTHLTALRNGATLGTPSAQGFGLALSTFDGGPDAESDAGRDAYLSARPLVGDEGDNVLTTYAGLSGAFTYEALVRIDFDPNAAGVVHGHAMQILSFDADESTNRVCEFRLVPGGGLPDHPGPRLEFINHSRDQAPQSITAKIPTAGPDALSAGNWYHVAVSYNGEPNRPDNLKLYWTLLDPNRTRASLIGTGQMQHSLPTGCQPDFAIGQTGRQSPESPHPDNHFVGLIDEVRVSALARSASQMMFGAPASVAATPAIAPSNRSAATPVEPNHPEGPGVRKGNAATWLIASGLFLIAGSLGWLAFNLKRFLAATRQTSARTRAVEDYAAVARPRPVAYSAELVLEPTAQPPPAVEKFPARPPAAEAAHPATPARSPTAGPEERNGISNDNVDRHSAAIELASEGFHGVLRKVGLQDLIQMECLNQRSSILEITTRKLSGRIYMERGEILHATAGKYSGEKAFIKLFSLRGGEFNLQPFEPPEERTIQCHWIHLLLEAARQRDEDTVRITRDKLAFTRSTTNTEDILDMAAMLADHPQVTEILVCSNEGKPLYNSKCRDQSGRALACLELLHVAKAASALLPVGEFDQIEILRPDSKTLIRGDQDCHLLIGLETAAFA